MACEPLLRSIRPSCSGTSPHNARGRRPGRVAGPPPGAVASRPWDDRWCSWDGSPLGSIPAVRAVLTPAVGGELLDGAAGDDLVEGGLLVAALAEDAPEALDVLAHAAGAREDDRDVGLGDVDALVQDPRRGHDRVRAGVE